MHLLGIYLALGAGLGVAAFLAAEWVREPHLPAAAHPGITALAAGMLWPIIGVGAVQLAAIIATRRLLGAAAPVPVLAAAR